MVRTTIVLPEEDYRELQAIAEAQDRSISWLLREAFRLSKSRLHRAEPFAPSFDRIWQDVGRSLRQAGITTATDVSRLVREVRNSRPPAFKGKGR
jgi:hypothetical protein